MAKTARAPKVQITTIDEAATFNASFDATVETTSNVIPVDFGISPVVTDFAIVSTPKGEIAQRLFNEAQVSLAGLTDAGKKAGTLRTLSSGRSDAFSINPYLIKIKDDRNSRDLSAKHNLDKIDLLARSISEIGVQTKLIVSLEGGEIFVSDGHTRLLATFRAIEVYGAEIKSVPVVVEDRTVTPVERVARQLLTGSPLTVFEMGANFVKLIRFGWKVKQIAAYSGLGAPRIEQILDLMQHATPEIKALVSEGKIAAHTAQTALKDAGNDADKALKALLAGVDVAQAAGKKRATAKHMVKVEGAAPKFNLKATLKGIFEDTTTDVDTSGSPTILVSMTAENWKVLARVLDI